MGMLEETAKAEDTLVMDSATVEIVSYNVATARRTEMGDYVGGGSSPASFDEEFDDSCEGFGDGSLEYGDSYGGGQGSGAELYYGRDGDGRLWAQSFGAGSDT